MRSARPGLRAPPAGGLLSKYPRSQLIFSASAQRAKPHHEPALEMTHHGALRSNLGLLDVEREFALRADRRQRAVGYVPNHARSASAHVNGAKELEKCVVG